jgi:hypothetical protein
MLLLLMLLWVVKYLNFMVIRQFDILSSYVKGINSIKEASNKDYIDIYRHIMMISYVRNQREVYDLPAI